jgi:hypothetical protein
VRLDVRCCNADASAGVQCSQGRGVSFEGDSERREYSSIDVVAALCM